MLHVSETQPRVRIFGGVKYRLEDSLFGKDNATEKAMELRSKGYKARVAPATQSYNSHLRGWYNIYIK